MTNYYIEKDEKIVRYGSNRVKFENTLKFMPEYQGLEIKETERPLVLSDDMTYYVFADDEEYQQEQAQKERERIAMLNLTAADVERGLYKAKGIDFDDVIRLVEAQPLSEDDKPAIDLKALKIELKANNFYRGNPYISAVGALLGLTDEQLNRFFEAGTSDDTEIKADAYKYLTPVTLTINPTPVDAVVTINNVQGSTIALPYGTIAAYKIEKEDYLTHLDTVELTEDTTLDIELEEENVNNENDYSQNEEENVNNNVDNETE